MPSQAHNTTKKAPPRAKGTTKSNSSSRKGKGTKKTATKSRKRAATESDSSEADESQSEDEPVKAPRRKKARVAERSNESEDVEDVDDVNPVVPPEEVSHDEDVNSGNENEVSNKIKRLQTKAHKSVRGMALLSINVG